MDIKQKERLEIDYWRNSNFESPKKFTKNNLLNKVQECLNLDYKIVKHLDIIRSKKSVLEVGAGQGWASCFLKKYYLPNAFFTVTDISPYAIASLENWENVFNVKIEKSYAAKSYQLDELDHQFDFIFCYAAAHHFVLLEQTLRELKRVLKKNGHIIFFYEPTCSKLFYPLYYQYVNKIPHHTPEDVIIPAQIEAICNKLDFKYTNQYDPNHKIIRSVGVGAYLKLLKNLPFLQKVLPSSSDLIFHN